MPLIPMFMCLVSCVSFQKHKNYVLECLAKYSVRKMPYAILPKHLPSEHKKVPQLTLIVLNVLFSITS